jgi:hypothetical protein
MENDLLKRQLNWFIDTAITIVVFLLYILICSELLLPGVGYHPDTIKYQFIGKVLGLSHPTGSPLYILINWVAAQIPIGELAWRINLMSTIFGGATLSVLFLLLRQLGLSWFSAITGSLVLASARLFLGQSLVAEVYTTHLFVLLIGLLFYIRWDRYGGLWNLALGSLFFGLSFAVHSMTVLVVPGTVIFLLVRKRRHIFRPARLTVVIAGMFAAILPFGYYLIRSHQQPIYYESLTRTLPELLEFVTGGHFQKSMFAFSWNEMINIRAPWALDQGTTNLGWTFLLAGFAGVIILTALRLRPGALFGLTLIASTWYAMGYDVGDAELFLFPALVSIAVGTAVLVEFIAFQVSRYFKIKPVYQVLGVILLSLVLILTTGKIYPTTSIDKSFDTDWQLTSKRLVSELDPGSLVISSDQWWFLSTAYQLWGAEMRRGESIQLTSVRKNDCEHLAELIDKHADQRTIYLTADLEGCINERSLTVERIDVSLNLLDYLTSLPDSCFVFLATFDEGTAGISKESAAALTQLGINLLPGESYRWSFVGAYIKDGDTFTGIQKREQGAVEIRLEEGDALSGAPLPFPIFLQSGGAISGVPLIMSVGDTNYARELRGLHIIVFDLVTGAPLDRKTIDTHKTTSLMNRYYFKLTE